MAEFKSGPISLSFGGEARDADADRAQLRAIHETLRSGDIAAAAGMAEAALAQGLEHPMLFNLAADRLEREDRLEEAHGLLQRGHELAPQDVGLRQALGLCLHRLERYAAALPHFDAVISAQPAFGPAHAARGATLEAIGDVTGAEAAYSRALELHPDNLAAISGLASLASRRGRHAEARALAGRVLEAQPGYPDAVMAVAQADLAQGDAARGEAALRALIADPRATSVQHALAEGLLGDIFDAQGRPVEAFAAYTACNQALRAAYAPRFGMGQGALAYARETLALLDRMPAGAWSSGPQARAGGVRGQVFLMGFPRSGTTLLEQVLASHPDVEALEERDTLADAMQAYGRQPQNLAELAAAPQAEITRLRAAYWQRVGREGARPAGKLFVDKHPLNAFRLPLIAKLFPDAKVLFARRDPRDVVLSCFRRRFAMSRPMYQLLTLQGAAELYDAGMQFGERLGGELALETLVVRHESLVEDFDAVAREVCGFLDLPWTEALRGFAARTQDRGIATPSGAQLASGLSAEGVGAWRRYAGQLAPVLPTLQPWVERFGYSAD
ncbi:tetratricopeptide repeat-containing sulfotransferase family protein [Phenylobacterium sp.]|uniref:tetratricopeptide repeat-containing sulfotransferase family protein n=1 Tax=Phenylobacterium sp. TaxID=1871053 RepID=UPI002E30C694|nr:sulfotransferase [Phenylobacterium sp.]HEX4711429.1 sulfotransferase [Phenylobacterium sp.]